MISLLVLEFLTACRGYVSGGGGKKIKEKSCIWKEQDLEEESHCHC